MNNPSIRLVSIVGRWDQPIFPPPKPIPAMAELIQQNGPLRPQARLLTKESRHERLR